MPVQMNFSAFGLASTTRFTSVRWAAVSVVAVAEKGDKVFCTATYLVAVAAGVANPKTSTSEPIKASSFLMNPPETSFLENSQQLRQFRN